MKAAPPGVSPIPSSSRLGQPAGSGAWAATGDAYANKRTTISAVHVRLFILRIPVRDTLRSLTKKVVD